MSRGGKREGSGRPEGTTKPENEKAKNRTLRLTDAEYKNYLDKGGIKWLRERLRDKNP